MDRFLDLLHSVKRNSNSNFYSCEPELIELMRQIDDMIQEKETVWQREVNYLESNFQVLKSENSCLRDQIKILNQTILITKKQLSDEKMNHSFTLTQYDRDVRMLKNDLKSIKKKYNGLQKKVELSAGVSNIDAKDTLSHYQYICSLCRSNQKCLQSAENIGSSSFGPLKLQFEAILLENSNLRSMLQQNNRDLLNNSKDIPDFIRTTVPPVADDSDKYCDSYNSIEDKLNGIITKFEDLRG